MKKLWLMVGNFVAFCGWPVLFVYLRIGKRTRIVLIAEDSVLVVKGWLGSSKWSLPGGGLHAREDPIVGVCRELDEETGLLLSGSDIQPLGQFRGGQRGLSFKYYGFISHLDQKINPKIKGWEIVETKWVPIKQLTLDNAQPETLELLMLI